MFTSGNSGTINTRRSRLLKNGLEMDTNLTNVHIHRLDSVHTSSGQLRWILHLKMLMSANAVTLQWSCCICKENDEKNKIVFLVNFGYSMIWKLRLGVLSSTSAWHHAPNANKKNNKSLISIVVTVDMEDNGLFNQFIVNFGHRSISNFNYMIITYVRHM